MPKHTFSTRDAIPVEEAMPGNAPSSPNSPANMAAAEKAGQAIVVPIRRARLAEGEAVARGERDQGQDGEIIPGAKDLPSGR